MAMGKRPAARQGSPLWVTTADLPTNAGHPFFERLNRVLDEAGFDAHCTYCGTDWDDSGQAFALVMAGLKTLCA